MIGVLVFSVFVYHRFTLGIDFGIYNQAVFQISHGNLNAFSTILGYPIVKSHFELILWPLSLLVVLFRTSFVLLFVQDICLVGTGLVVFMWVAKLLESRNLSRRVVIAILAGTTALIIVDPLLYYSAALDFHIEATATFFAAFAAFDIWSGQNWRAPIWLGLCLLCGDIGGLYVAGVGISSTLASPGTRRMGMLAVAAGIAWVGLIIALGDNQGSHFASGYGYLAGRPTVVAGVGGGLAVIGGVVTHPARWLGVLRDRLHLIVTYLLPGGVIGVVTAWGVGVPAVVLLSSSLQATPLFISNPFQRFAVFPFVLFGTVLLLTWLISDDPPALLSSDRWSRHRIGRQALSLVAAACAGLGALLFAGQRLPVTLKVTPIGGFIPGDEASVLRQVLARTPSSAEVIVSLPVSGRFSSRKYVCLYLTAGAPIPVHRGIVLLVMDTAHSGPFVSQAHQQQAADYAVAKFHARTIVHAANIWALEWSAATPISSVALP